MIRPAQISDAAAICSIYNPYVLQTCVTFEEDIVSETEMADRIADVTESLPWLVMEEQDRVVGYAYASRWKSRCAYRFSVESTIYLDRDMTGRGRGRTLYEALLAEIRQSGRHSVLAGIALPNPASQRLHESLGFKKVAHFEEVGRKFDQWIDVGYWELIFPAATPQ